MFPGIIFGFSAKKIWTILTKCPKALFPPKIGVCAGVYELAKKTSCFSSAPRRSVGLSFWVLFSQNEISPFGGCDVVVGDRERVRVCGGATLKNSTTRLSANWSSGSDTHTTRKGLHMPACAVRVAPYKRSQVTQFLTQNTIFAHGGRNTEGQNNTIFGVVLQC